MCSRGFDGDGVHRHLSPVVAGRTPSGDLNVNGTDHLSAAEVHVHLAGHELYFVEVVVQEHTQILLTPAAVFHGDALGYPITQAVGVSNAFALHDLYRELLNEPPQGLHDDDISSHSVIYLLKR